MREYHKIETVFERDSKTKKLINGKFRNETVEFLKDNIWQFTEKVDGTNVRIYWDGHNVTFGGRTDNAQIPAHLINRLNELFGGYVNEQLFEQKFGGTPVELFGEGYGPKIQKGGGLYRDSVDFVLFDVLINDTYLKRESVEDIANYFGIDAAPMALEGTIQDAIDYVKQNPNSLISKNGAKMEGVVGRPKVEIKDRLGKRVIVKVKYNDFKEEK